MKYTLTLVVTPKEELDFFYDDINKITVEPSGRVVAQVVTRGPDRASYVREFDANVRIKVDTNFNLDAPPTIEFVD